MNKGINEVFNALLIDKELPHLNDTPTTNYSDFYDEESKQIIADWFREDFIGFGYQF